MRYINPRFTLYYITFFGVFASLAPLYETRDLLTHLLIFPK